MNNDLFFSEIPFGKRVACDGTLVDDEREQRVIRAWADCRRAGMSWKEICRIMDQAEGDRPDHYWETMPSTS